MSKQFWGVVAVIVLIFVGIFALSGSKSNKSSSSSSTGSVSSHVEGKGTTNVTLVEYGDYECPFCGQFYPVVKQVESQFDNQIKFQFVNFPLVSIHQNAFAGARAAEAAAMQNKFWEMHDILYANQSTWSVAGDPSTYFTTYATQLGLNVTQFKTDYASSKVNDTINADIAKGNKAKVEGTPTFYLDGKQINVGQASSAGPVFVSLINAEISKKAGKASSTSTTPATTPTTQSTGSSTGQ